MIVFPKLPKGVSWKDVRIEMPKVPKEEQGREVEPIFRNKKTGEIYT